MAFSLTLGTYTFAIEDMPSIVKNLRAEFNDINEKIGVTETWTLSGRFTDSATGLATTWATIKALVEADDITDVQILDGVAVLDEMNQADFDKGPKVTDIGDPNDQDIGHMFNHIPFTITVEGFKPTTNSGIIDVTYEDSFESFGFHRNRVRLTRTGTIRTTTGKSAKRAALRFFPKLNKSPKYIPAKDGVRSINKDDTEAAFTFIIEERWKELPPGLKIDEAVRSIRTTIDENDNEVKAFTATFTGPQAMRAALDFRPRNAIDSDIVENQDDGSVQVTYTTKRGPRDLSRDIVEATYTDQKIQIGFHPERFRITRSGNVEVLRRASAEKLAETFKLVPTDKQYTPVGTNQISTDNLDRKASFTFSIEDRIEKLPKNTEEASRTTTIEENATSGRPRDKNFRASFQGDGAENAIEEYIKEAKKEVKEDGLSIRQIRRVKNIDDNSIEIELSTEFEGGGSGGSSVGPREVEEWDEDISISVGRSRINSQKVSGPKSKPYLIRGALDVTRITVSGSIKARKPNILPPAFLFEEEHLSGPEQLTTPKVIERKFNRDPTMYQMSYRREYIFDEFKPLEHYLRARGVDKRAPDKFSIENSQPKKDPDKGKPVK